MPEFMFEDRPDHCRPTEACLTNCRQAVLKFGQFLKVDFFELTTDLLRRLETAQLRKIIIYAEALIENSYTRPCDRHPNRKGGLA